MSRRLRGATLTQIDRARRAQVHICQRHLTEWVDDVEA
jgi:hypothetical protein